MGMPWARITTVPSRTVSGDSATATPRLPMRSSAWGLWMSGPSVCTARPSLRTEASSTASMARFTPQQKPAVLATITFMATPKSRPDWSGNHHSGSGAEVALRS